MDDAFENAELDRTLMLAYYTKLMAKNGEKMYWVVDPTKQRSHRSADKLKKIRTEELFQEAVYLTAVLLHLEKIGYHEVRDDYDKYFDTLKSLALKFRSECFNESVFTSFRYYKTKASNQNIIRFLTLCGKMYNGDQNDWLLKVYDSDNIMKIFFPNLFNTNIRTFSTLLKDFIDLQETARSCFVKDVNKEPSDSDISVYEECNPFTILENIRDKLWSPKPRSAWDNVPQEAFSRPIATTKSPPKSQEGDAKNGRWAEVREKIMPKPEPPPPMRDVLPPRRASSFKK